MIILRIGITPTGDVTAASASSTLLSKLWKKEVRDVFYAKVEGKNSHHQNPKTVNCVTILLYDLSIPKKEWGKPLEIKVYFEDGASEPHKVTTSLYPESYKTNTPVENLLKAIYRADELYSGCGGGVTYKHPFSKIPALCTDLKIQLHTGVIPIRETA